MSRRELDARRPVALAGRGFPLLLGVLLAIALPAAAQNRFFIEQQMLPAGGEGQVVLIRADIDLPDGEGQPQGLSAFQVALKFDPAVIQVTAIDVADDAAGAFFKPPLDKAVNNATGEIFYGVLVSEPAKFDPDKIIPKGTNRQLVRLVVKVLSSCDTESVLDLRDKLPSNPLASNVMSVPPGVSIRSPALQLTDGQLTIETDLDNIQGRFELQKGKAKEGKAGWTFGLTKATYDPGFEIPGDRIDQLLIGVEVDGEAYFTNPALQKVKMKIDKKSGNLAKISIKEGKDKLLIDLLKDRMKLSLKNIPPEKFSPTPGASPVAVTLTLASDDTLFRNVARVDASLQILVDQAGKKLLLQPGAGEVLPEAKPCD